MLKIVSSGDVDVMTLRLEGRLAERWVDEVTRVLAQVQAAPARVLVDLSEVTYVDERGVSLLRDLARRGVDLAGGSSFVRTLIGETPHDIPR